MISVRGHGRLLKKRPPIPLFDFFLAPESDNNLSDQLAEPLGANFFVAVIAAAAPTILKYTKKDLRQILKTVLETQNKLLKACFPEVYRRESHMECYNFCQ